jgi:hypothetical protein
VETERNALVVEGQLASAWVSLVARVRRREREDVMDGSSFDRFVQLATPDVSRRSLLKSALVPALAGLGITSFLVTGEVEAKNKKRKKKKRCKKAGSPCTSNKQCCPSKTNRICEVPVNGGNSDTVCCGGEGAKCGGNNEDGDDLSPFCCVGFECNSDTESPGICVRVSDEL